MTCTDVTKGLKIHETKENTRQEQTKVDKNGQHTIPIIFNVNGEQCSPGLGPCPLSRQGQ